MRFLVVSQARIQETTKELLEVAHGNTITATTKLGSAVVVIVLP